MAGVRELLAQPPNTINVRVLLRAIAEHASWFVPIASFRDRNEFEQIVLPPDGQIGAVPDELWLFTDREAVDRAPQAIGFGSLSGLEVCASLDPAWRAMQLNPGSEQFLTAQLPPVVRAQLAQLARAIPLERELEELGSGARHALVYHPNFFVALDRGAPVTAPTRDGSAANAILVFTAADAVDGLLERVPRENHANVQVNSINGRELFGNIGMSSIDGMLVNPFGPRASVSFGAEDLVELVALAREP